MVGLIQRILGRTSHPLNQIFISRQRLVSNYKTLSRVNSKIKVAPVLKSNAYGHGLAEIGKIVDNFKLPFICVDSLYEALLLRKAKVKSDILIMGYIDPESLMRKKFNFSFAVWDLQTAQVLNKFQKGASVHIFVDTGMSREGIRVNQLEDFLSELKLLKNLRIDGLMSHLACSDEPKNSMNNLQLNNFKKAKDLILKSGLKPKWFHLGGSYALLNQNPKDCNLIRVGKALYGVLTPEARVKYPSLKPVLKLTSKIAQIKNLKKGDKVGYSSTFTAQKEMKSAVLPIGYNDGLDRSLSSKGSVIVSGKVCPIIGRISMNLTSIDISLIKDPYVGQEVIVFSDDINDPNTIEKCELLTHKIPYELLVHLHPSTRRVIRE